ncbi:MAG: site-specific integrase [Pseudonocardiales bacterium]|nr:site-specific integrase [Pseudonocardiales bacterium]
MGHIQDRWYRTRTDPETGKPVLDSNGKPVREKTELYGKGNRYRVRYVNPDGQERARTYPDRQLAVAKAFLHKVETDIRQGSYLDPNAGKVIFREFAEKWLASRTFDESTRENMEFRFKLHVYPYFGDRELRDVKPSLIREWGRALQKKGLAETYRRTIFANVSGVFTAAIDDELINKNPCNAGSVIKPRGEYPKVIPWTEERVHAVRAALGERYQVLVNLGAGCGLRQGEVFGLSPDDVDEESGVIRVERQIKIVRSRMVLGLPKHRKKREVPLPASVLKAIKEHRKCFPPLQVALPWEEPTGKPITVELLVYTREHKQLYRHSFNHYVWKPALRSAGIVAPSRAEGFHALRHFYASVLLDGGENIRALAEYLGHADPAFTLRTYTHLMPSSSERTRKAVDQVFDGKAPA